MKRWRRCVVAAPGPSLTPEVAAQVRESGLPVVAVQDAYRLLPFADVLYGCDRRWWNEREGCPDFQGEKWSSHSVSASFEDNKDEAARRWGLNLILGQDGETFAREPDVIHYGSNSGFQAVNLAIQFGATFIVLVGFDMRMVGGKRHFFGDHAAPLRNTEDYSGFVTAFTKAAAKLPAHITIINCTPGSALTCFPMMSLEDAIEQSPAPVTA